MDIRIRRARGDEAEALTSLARRAKASRGYPEAWLEAWQEDLRFAPGTFQRCEVFVAEVDRRPVGVVALSDDAGTREGEIEHLWVEPAVQRAGIGRRLVRHALSRARRRGLGGIRVVSDPGARGFYEHLGATLAGHVSAPVLGTERELPVLRFELDPAVGGGLP